MYIRPYGTRSPSRSTLPSTRHGIGRRILISVVALVGLTVGVHLVTGHAAASVPAIRSAEAGLCLDVRHNAVTPGTPVDAWTCNNSAAQAWVVHNDTIEHGKDLCLSVQGDRQSTGSAIVVNTCQATPGQIWLRDHNGFENPNSGSCLSIAPKRHAASLILASCDAVEQPSETWLLSALTGSSTVNAACQSETGGQRIACFAEQEWSMWQDESDNHEVLLTQYTDGAPYEEWCADFVSYVYKEAGYPFTLGGANSWDESDANNIQNMGFTRHDPLSYTPQPGDVAYFDYDGGHVEIVVSGGKTPTFVYGNSGTTDPTTGNGQMAANTITHDGESGGLVYYLSPDLH